MPAHGLLSNCAPEFHGNIGVSPYYHNFFNTPVQIARNDLKTSQPTERMSVKAPEACRVLIVDDHPWIAHLLSQLVQQQDGFVVAGVAHDAPSALGACAEGKLDLVILDIGLPDKNGGLGALRDIRQRFPHIRILVFSAFDTMHVVQAAMRLGAHGYLEKTAPLPELLEALRRVRVGATYLGARASSLLRDLVKNGLQATSLAAQEQTILELLARGAVVKEIASALHLSPSMIYKLLTRLRARLGAKTNEDLIVVAVQHGWLEIEPAKSIAGTTGSVSAEAPAVLVSSAP